MSFDVAIRVADPRAADIRALIAELDRYAASLYPAESNHLLDVEALAQPEVRFFAITVDGVAQGCGGCWLKDGFAEIKRVYVRPPFRGLGLARKVMAVIEAAARDAGRSVSRLETGIKQPEAIALYRSLGYSDRAPFGGYAADPNSVFMEKLL